MHGIIIMIRPNASAPICSQNYRRGPQGPHVQSNLLVEEKALTCTNGGQITDSLPVCFSSFASKLEEVD